MTSRRLPVGDAPAVTAKALEGCHGISYRQINHWISRGYLRTREGRTVGSGNVFSFTDAEVQVFDRMARLVLIGIRPSMASRVARAMVEQNVTWARLPHGLAIVDLPLVADKVTLNLKATPAS